MSKFKIGDRVKCLSDHKFVESFREKSIKGKTGTVKEINSTHIGVEFDDYVGGHNGSWNGKNGYCWYIEKQYVEKIEETEVKVEELRVGQRVETVAISSKAKHLKDGMRGIVKRIKGDYIGVEFDDYVGCTAGNWGGKLGHSSYLIKSKLKKLNKWLDRDIEKIVIETDESIPRKVAEISNVLETSKGYIATVIFHTPRKEAEKSNVSDTSKGYTATAVFHMKV